MLISLKHVCQEFKIDPYSLRLKLRKELPHRKNQRWSWSADDKQLIEVKRIAKEISDARTPRTK
jgi:hypothetical protein